jgi:hypothetical protein
VTEHGLERGDFYRPHASATSGALSDDESVIQYMKWQKTATVEETPSRKETLSGFWNRRFD